MSNVVSVTSTYKVPIASVLTIGLHSLVLQKNLRLMISALYRGVDIFHKSSMSDINTLTPNHIYISD